MVLMLTLRETQFKTVVVETTLTEESKTCGELKRKQGENILKK